MSYSVFEKILLTQGVSRRSFIKYCTTLASLLALPPSMILRIVHALENAPRQSVIWLHFQDCTACSKSFVASHSPSIESLLLEHISLDYHHTLQAIAGEGAEHLLETTIQTHQGNYLLIVEGALPLAHPGYCTIGGMSSVEILKRVAQGAKAIIAVGTCASFGGIPHAVPNPTGAVAVHEVITDKQVINVSGCPPIPLVITGLIGHFLALGSFPELDQFNRPFTFFGDKVHRNCPRRTFFNDGLFAERFDDEGAKQGWCLFKLGCKGTITYNACPTLKWNNASTFPVEAGHGCLGCAEPHFWEGGSFYQALSSPPVPALPPLGPAQAFDQEGEFLSVETSFAGGISIPEGIAAFHRLLTVRLSTVVKVQGSMTIDPLHVGQTVEILVYAAYQTLGGYSSKRYFMLNQTGEILPWDEQVAHLIAFKSVTLTAVQAVLMYQGHFIAPGSLNVYFGYRLSDGTVVTNSQTIDITITE